jgi:nicotinamide-nucleotide adenylyltransferase
MKKYKCGLYIGRFQPLHDGHWDIIDRMISECNVAIIAIGSAQESGTERNPFSYGIRASLIYNTCEWVDLEHRNIMVIPVADREHPSNDPSWGDYLLNTVKTYTGLTPDVIYEGQETERSNWYDNYNIPIVSVERSIRPISATELRQALLDGDEQTFCNNTPFGVGRLYKVLREEILKCKD